MAKLANHTRPYRRRVAPPSRLTPRADSIFRMDAYGAFASRAGLCGSGKHGLRHGSGHGRLNA